MASNNVEDDVFGSDNENKQESEGIENKPQTTSENNNTNEQLNANVENNNNQDNGKQDNNEIDESTTTKNNNKNKSSSQNDIDDIFGEEEEEESENKKSKKDNNEEEEEVDQQEQQDEQQEENNQDSSSQHQQREELQDPDEPMEDEEIDAPLLPISNQQKYSLILSGVALLDSAAYNSNSRRQITKTLENNEEKQYGPNSIIRWRKNEQGEAESNSRLVKWSDGSWQLLIGSESYDIQVITDKKENDYLYSKHPNGLYQSEGAMPQKFVVKPPMQVIAKGAEKKIKLVTPDQNPDKLNEDLQKKEDARVRLSRKKTNKRKANEGEMNESFLEGEREDDGDGDDSDREPEEGDISAIKAQYGMKTKKKSAKKKKTS